MEDREGLKETGEKRKERRGREETIKNEGEIERREQEKGRRSKREKGEEEGKRGGRGERKRRREREKEREEREIKSGGGWIAGIEAYLKLWKGETEREG